MVTLTRRYVPLFWRLFLPNATVLGTACVVLMIEPANGRVVALVGGLTAMLAVNLVLMRHAIAPLARLSGFMGQIDPLRPGQRISVSGPESEVTVLAQAFNDMLDRLEQERRDSGRRALSAQESERRHLAAELHDDIGQGLTALAFELNRLADRLADDARADALRARDSALELVEDVRGLARQLRPEALDALGLVSALINLVERLSAQTGLSIDRDLERDLPALHPDTELVVYRVAQESLTNVVRHARADRVELRLQGDKSHIELTIRDDGVGVPLDGSSDGGIRNMRERALLIGADLRVVAIGEGGGTEVRLRIHCADSVP